MKKKVKPQQQQWYFTETWTAQKRADGFLAPGYKISGSGISNHLIRNKDTRDFLAESQRKLLEEFGRIKPGEPYFEIEGKFVLHEEPK